MNSARAQQPSIADTDAVADYTGTMGDDLNALSNAVRLRILTPRGSYWADPTLGSDLHLLARNKALPNRIERARQYIVTALQPLLDSRRADRIEVGVTLVGNSLQTQTKVFQAGAQVAGFDYSVRVE